MKNKISLVILTIFLTASLIYAANFEIKEIPNDIIVFDGENATFSLEIENNMVYKDYYKIDSVDFNWLLNDKLSLVNLEVPAGGSKIIPLTFEPAKTLEKKMYGVNLMVTSQATNTKIEKTLQLLLASPSSVFDVELIGPDQVDSRKDDNKVELKISNNFNNDYKDLIIVLSSDVFNENKKITLLSKETKLEEFNLRIDKEAEEGEHKVDVSFYSDNKLVGKNEISLMISHYKGIREIITNDNSFLLYKEYTKKINDGNSVAYQKFTKKMAFFQKLCTRTTPKPEIIIKENGNYIMTWNLELEPGEETEINIITNYRTPLIGLLLLLAIAGVSYYNLRRDILVNKKVMTIKSGKDVSKTKVLLTIRNKGKKLIKNIKIMDRTNNVADTPNEFGSLEPFKINKIGKSIELIWKIDSLGAGEEVKISYDVESKVHNGGTLLFPPALARYSHNNKTFVSKSNNVSISRK